ncbi:MULTISPECIES: type VI secretion system tip protein TssI/VgrG [unclassified Motilimonas]|uniref:type VI secretion system Vgr family protein n=1 Tax=unclassified Motilimonas TaxID=2643697 RepID=UPI001E65C608|nr:MULTISPECIES: type VI secretion system tip protein TssI/VgrG [unclassified Motilimonas]MCE0557546.1 type VI secretion system tip protein VgrG [Motilimonas sp. E26]MDO6524570.1 type VI secretion system tip protein TssI/VgrG [Motilimonas sp. 1_MG-2023]
MAEQYTDETSLLSASDYKNDVYSVIKLSVNEQLSSPFEITLELIAKNFNAKEQLGQAMTIERFSAISGMREQQRAYHGYITHIQQTGWDHKQLFATYRLTLRPWLWLLSHTLHHRVYQNKTTQDIVSDIFTEAGFKGMFKCNAMPSTKREYCLQYNESDLDFVSRLLAEEGVHYFFEHSKDKHTLILQDAQKPFVKAKQSLFDHSDTPSGEHPLINTWLPQYTFHSASLELNNYDYEQTKLVSSKVKKSSNKIANNTKLTKQHFPAASISGKIDDLSSNLIKRRIEQLEQDYQQITAESTSDDFVVGQWFSLKNHPDKSQQGDYLVISSQSEYQADGQTQVQLLLCSSNTNYYPTPKPKPQIIGLQSATVAGSSKGQPSQDDEGRVRILFQWDTKTSGDKTSCYVRVAQSMAGNGYGCQFIPRAGQEVLVSFINGDPDSPVVTGSVYNSKQKPPYKDTDSTQSGIKTKLSGQSNELRFDDKKDNEELYLHAAKDSLFEIENNHTQTIKGEEKRTVTKKMTISTQDDYALTADKGISEKAKTITLEADDKIELKVGSSKITMTTSSIKIESSDIQVKASKGLKLQGMTFDAKASTSAKLSGASVDVKASGAGSFKALSLTLDAKTTLTAQSKLSTDVKSNLKTSVGGGVMTEVKGAIVKVN